MLVRKLHTHTHTNKHGARINLINLDIPDTRQHEILDV